MITLIVLNGISPQGTLLVARARHSFGGTDCKKCSTAGNNSTGSRMCFSRSCGIFRASFQTHLRTSSATLASCESGLVPFAGNGLTIRRSKANSALGTEHQRRRTVIASFNYSPENGHSPAGGEQPQYDHVDKARQILHLAIWTVVRLQEAKR